MTTISVFIDDEEKKILESRAKKNLMTLKEQAEDIIRRSCVRTKSKSVPYDPCDDKLVKIFSKSRRGRKSKKKTKK